MRRNLTGIWLWSARGIAVVFALWQLWALGPGRLPDMQQRAVHVGFGLVLTFLLLAPVRRQASQRKVPWLDLTLIVITLAVVVNTYLKFEWFATHVGQSAVIDLVLGAAIILLSLEAARRTTGWVFPIITGVMIFYAFMGPYFPGVLRHRGIQFELFLQQLTQSPVGVWGYITGTSATIIAGFLILGAVLMVSGGGRTFVDLAMKAVGKLAGGGGLVSVIASAFFASLTGSAVVDVATTGSLTIPLMKRLKYSPEVAGGIAAIASAGAQLTPPVLGSGVFVMAVLLAKPYSELVGAFIIPALLYYISLFFAVYFEAKKKNLPPVPAAEIPTARDVFRWSRLAPLLIPVSILIAMLMTGFTAELSCLGAFIGAVGYFVFSPPWSAAGLRKKAVIIGTTLEAGGKSIMEIVSLVVCSNVVVALIGMTGLGVKVSEIIMALGNGQLFLALLLSAVLVIALGMGIPTIAAYVVAISVTGFIFGQLGMTPLVYHFFVFYYAVLAVVTPPVCLATYAAAAIAKANWWKVGWHACRLGAVPYIIPFVVVFNPAFLLIGNPRDIIIATLTASVGACGLSAGLGGFLFHKLIVPERILIVIGSILLFIPGARTDIAGAGILLVTILLHFLFRHLGKSRKALAGLG